MADLKKKSATLFTHWARPRVRTYEYNYEYGESYYRPLVRYISTSRAFAASSSFSSSSSVRVESRRSRLERRRRAISPPGPLSFIERWSNEPFYGYGIGFRSRAGRASSEQITSSSSLAYESSLSSTSRISSNVARAQSVSRALEMSRAESESRSRARSMSRERERSVSRAESVARSVRAHSVARAQSIARSVEQESSALDVRSRRARSIDIAARYASDDCLMRSNALNSALAASQEILNTNSLTRRTLHLDNQNVLHGRTLDERYYVDYPKQHLVCPPNCPLHNNPEWRRRFLIGNRFLDAAALGGFDVLYDPTVFNNSRRLLSKLAERSEYETDEISIQRSSDLESSRRRIRATASMA